MIRPRVLVVYKKSVHEVYFLDPHSSCYGKQRSLMCAHRKRIKSAHEAHYRTLQEVEAALRDLKVCYAKRFRGYTHSTVGFDLIVSVGGDGTFLEAMRGVTNQVMLGVNSDPAHSVGRFCAADRHSFRAILKKYIAGKYKPQELSRLALKFHNRACSAVALNDILVCHRNPAALNRYIVTINRETEEQRSSGMWIASAAGSSGAIRSAGGRLMKSSDVRIQYMPRELYVQPGVRYGLTGAILARNCKIHIRSLMRAGALYVDGAHQKYPFGFGDHVTISRARQPLKIINNITRCR